MSLVGRVLLLRGQWSMNRWKSNSAGAVLNVSTVRQSTK